MGQTASGVFETPVRLGGIAGDQQAALFGQNCFARGMAKNTYGTGCFMLMNIGTAAVPSRHQLITTIAWKARGRTEFALEGSVFIGGAVVQWLRDGLGLIKTAREIEALAASVPDCGGVYLVPAFAGLGAPHWDQYARGTHHRADARHDGGSPGAGGVGRHRVSSGRGAGRDERGLGTSALANCGWTGGRRPTTS